MMEAVGSVSTIPKAKSGINEAENRVWLVESLSHVPFQDSEELNLEIPSFDTDQFRQMSTESDRREDASVFEVSLDSWLYRLHTDTVGESDGSYVIRTELMLSPEIIRAPLRSVRPDKRAIFCS